MMLLILFGVCLNAVVNHLGIVCEALRYFVGLISPVLLGFAFAFLLSIPVNALEKHIVRPHGCWCLALQKKAQRPLSIFLSIALAVCIVVFVGSSVVPSLAESLQDLATQLPAFLESIKAAVQPYLQDNPNLSAWVDHLHIDGEAIEKNLVDYLQGAGGELAGTVISAATSVFGQVFSLIMAVIIGISATYNKERLCSQATELLRACFKPEKAEQILGFLRRVGQVFNAFLTGQVLEAFILGCMVLVGMLIFGFPYAPVVSVLVMLMAFIPIIGAWVSAIIGAVLVFSQQGLLRAICFVLMIIVLQQIEGNLIYPRVMGKRVGLPSLWVLVGVTLGSGLFGLWGLLLSVPLFAVVYQLLRDFTAKRKRERQCASDAAASIPETRIP